MKIKIFDIDELHRHCNVRNLSTTLTAVADEERLPFPTQSEHRLNILHFTHFWKWKYKISASSPVIHMLSFIDTISKSLHSEFLQ